MKKKKKTFELASGSTELNVMPFIDIFSLLCTFLLFSSVFISLGIHTVQVPFLSNSKSLEKRLEDVKRELSLVLHVKETELKLSSKWSQKPVEKKTQIFDHTDDGLRELHSALLVLKEKSRESQKVEIFIDDDITYESMTDVLDEVTNFSHDDELTGNLAGLNKLFPKVVLSNVLY